MIGILALICFVWYIVVLSLAYYGVIEIFVKYRGTKTIPRYNLELEQVTILRPLKGIDPELELCLESSFLQQYPVDKVELIFCVETLSDPAVSVVEALIKKYPKHDAKLLIGDAANPDHYGPNPKINNLAKGFLSAKYDIIWVMDSNVWVSGGALSRSVVALNRSTTNGRVTKARPVKLVHHVPLAVTLKGNLRDNFWYANLGCKLDEVFMKTAHAKFYVAFDKLSIAPCVNGKSNMYRRSDIDTAVRQIGQGHMPSSDGQSGDLQRDAAFYGSREGFGIRYFSKFIGEDNMIGIALWDIGGRTGLSGDCVIQPLGNSVNNGVRDYVLRRLRWLRVRKYMVLAATLLEPTTESIVAAIYGTFGVSYLFLGCNFSLVWFMCHFIVWFVTDYFQFQILLNYASAEDPSIDSATFPYFAFASYNGLTNARKDQTYSYAMQWLVFWALREVLALPIWAYAMVSRDIDWRGRPFRINSDLTAEEI